MLNSADVMKNANRAGVVIPAFNAPYLPMIEPVIRAVIAEDAFALIEVARLEWTKFEAQNPSAVMAEFNKWQDSNYVRIHLDHIPVIDEDNQRVDFLTIIREAIDVGYHSVMVDGSRLSLEENIKASQRAVDLAHQAGIPCEAELGAVLGHEAGPLPPYDELYASGSGFTDVQEAQRFVRETNCDWLSVAIGNVHGAVSGTLKDKKKVQAKLNLDHLNELHQATSVPLVLHGGSGVQREYLLAAIKKGISKVNVGTEIRQTYESALLETASVSFAQNAVYERTSWLIHDYFELTGSRQIVTAGSSAGDLT